MNSIRYLGVGLVLVLGTLLAACSTNTGTPLAANPPVEVDQKPTDTPGSEELPPATEAVVAQPTPRPELEATDPTTVVLAAGQPQIVEFFAYW